MDKILNEQFEDVREKGLEILSKQYKLIKQEILSQGWKNSKYLNTPSLRKQNS